MEQQTRRERKKEETRRKIMDVAFKLFVEQGFDNTTIDQITEQADVGKGTFYNYFPSKEAVFFDFMEDLGNQRGEKLWAGILEMQDTRQRLARTFKSTTSWFEEYPELMRIYIIDRVNAGLKNPRNYKHNNLERYLFEILKMGQEIGDIRDDVEPMQLVNYMDGIFLMQIIRWFENGAGPGLYELVMQGVDFFLIGALSTEKD